MNKDEAHNADHPPKSSDFPIRRLSQVGWSEEVGLEPRYGSRLPLISPRTRGAGSGTFHTRRPDLEGGCQGFTGPEPSTLLDELHGYHATATQYTTNFLKVQLFRQKNIISRNLHNYLRGRSPSPLVGRAINPDRYASAWRAASRPSLIAQTTKDCPRRASPAANTPDTLV